MQLNSPALLTQFLNLLQGELFPLLEGSVGPLSKYNLLLAQAVSLVPLVEFHEEECGHGPSPPGPPMPGHRFSGQSRL